MKAVDALRSSPFFESLDAPLFQALVDQGQWVELRGGESLITAGEPSDSLHILVTGRLRVSTPAGDKLGEVGPGEPIGEIGLLVDEPRVANVIALRDSILIRFERPTVLETLRRYPDAMLILTQTIIRRLRRTRQEARRARALGQHAIALIPLVDGLDLSVTARALEQALSRHGSVRLLDPATVDAALGAGAHQTLFADAEQNPRVVQWLADQERSHRYLLYLCPPEAGAWARRCMRQADRLLLAVTSGETPAATAMVDELVASGIEAPRDVLMLQPQPGTQHGDVLGWRQQVQAQGHFYVPGNGDASAADYLARTLTRRAIGLVLGGGGARGFAHLGLFRALHELDIPVDLSGGSSMGAYFAALHALGHDFEAMREITHDTFVAHNLLNDYVFPSVALIRGRKFFRHLHTLFGDVAIEDLPRRYFCVSSNLSRGRLEVHDRGPLHLWVATSMAVPGVAPPVVWNEDLLVDGALLNSLPTDIMDAMDTGPILASDVSTGGELTAPGVMGPDPEGLFNWKGDARRPSLLNIMFRTATVGGQRDARARAARADVYLRMPVTDVGMFDWKRFDEVANRGYEYALEQLTPLRESLIRGAL
jgi:NTE family protein